MSYEKTKTYAELKNEKGFSLSFKMNKFIKKHFPVTPIVTTESGVYSAHCMTSISEKINEDDVFYLKK